MHFIGLEEHYWTPEIAAALDALPSELKDDSLIVSFGEVIRSKLEDIGEGRLKEMDLIGLDMMVLSVTTPATQALPAEQAVPLAAQANDRLATSIKAHPDRFAGFATLPTPDPEAAARELHRAVGDLGMVGVMIHGRTGDRYLDHPTFRPILAKAAELNVPIYMHPQIPPRSIRAYYYDGFETNLSLAFASGGWGWHADAGIGALRLIVSGVFDEYPNLQIILGHWGETVLPYLERTNVLSAFSNLKRPVAEYFRHNFYITGSGMYNTPYLQKAIEVMGIDRIMVATDYPFIYHPDKMARHFIEQAPISLEYKEKLAFRNAQQLLRLKGWRQLA